MVSIPAVNTTACARLSPWLLALLLSAPAAQSPGPGFAAEIAHTETGALANASSFVASRDGSALYFAHQHLLYVADLGGSRRIVAWFNPGEPIGTLSVDPRDDRIWLTNFTTDGLFVFEPRTTSLRAVGSAPRNTFALAVDPASGTLLASANPLWPAPDAATGIWAVDLVQAQHREIVRCSGPSGPIALGPAGELLYATQATVFPPPPGQTDLLRLSPANLAQVLAGGARLRQSDLQLVTRGLDGAYDLAVDARGHAYVSDVNFGQVRRVSLATGAIDPSPTLRTGTLGTTSLSHVAGVAPRVFAPFQPNDSGALFVTLPDWRAIRTDVIRVRPRRPELHAFPGLPLPRGPARLELSGAVPNAACALFLSVLPPVPEYQALRLDDLPIWATLDPGFPWLVWPASTDAAGGAVFAFRHEAPGAFALSAQALSLTSTALGTSACLVITFLP